MSDGERVFGFGEHQNGRLDSKGLRFDFEQCIEYFPSKGGEVCLPWILAADAGAVQYGFLCNNPSYGAVDFGAEGTTWSARGPARRALPRVGALPQRHRDQLRHAFARAVLRRGRRSAVGRGRGGIRARHRHGERRRSLGRARL